MKKLLILSLTSLSLITGCASMDNKKKSKSKEDARVKKEKVDDVKSVDGAYSTNLRIFSNVKASRTKYNCASHLKIDKSKWEDLLESGFSCIQKKNWPELSKIAQKLSHNHLKAPWGPYYKSVVAENRGDLARAMWMAELALKKAPDHPVILFQKARILWMTKKETTAYQILRKVEKLDPNNYDALLFLGEVHYRDRDFKDALSYFERVSKYKNKDSAFRAAVAECNFFLEKYQESIKHYKAAVQGQKLNAPLYYKMGLSYKNLKKWSMAKVSFEKAIAQGKKGRSIASLENSKVATELKSVVAKIEAEKGKKNEKSKK